LKDIPVITGKIEQLISSNGELVAEVTGVIFE
jgi:hypothetical protein